MIRRHERFTWPGIERQTYKDEPGTWVGVDRRVLNPGASASFEARYFELQPGGYTSFERHQHEHFVMVARGSGLVRLGDEWSTVETGDVVHILPKTPHQFRNDGDAPFGIVCIVDKDRDLPVLLGDDGLPRASESEASC